MTKQQEGLVQATSADVQAGCDHPRVARVRKAWRVLREISGYGLSSYGILVLSLHLGSGLWDAAVGAICGSMIAVGIMLDTHTRKPAYVVSMRRREIARKIAIHLKLQIKGDVWTLTAEDFDVILDALGSAEKGSAY